jgi:hypothetical protein
MGNYLRLWDTFFELERIQYRALFVSLEKPFGRYCNQYIYKTVPTLEEWLRIADEFNNIWATLRRKQRAEKLPHQMPTKHRIFLF